MWARRLSLICAIAAGGWAALVSTGLFYAYIVNHDAWLLPILALFPVAFAALGLIGIIRSDSVLVAFSAMLLALFFFSPGLVGIPYLPSAGAMGLATVFAWFVPSRDDQPVRRLPRGDRFYGA